LTRSLSAREIRTRRPEGRAGEDDCERLPAANTGGSDEQRRNHPGKVEHVHRVRRHGIERDRCGYRLRRDGVDDV